MVGEGDKKLIEEKELVLPALFLMEAFGGSVTTTKIQSELFDILQPSGNDIKILAGRNDTHFSQKVRNLVSHRKLDRLGYAVYTPKTKDKAGFIQITPNGKKHLSQHIDSIKYLLSNNFDWDDVRSGLVDVADTKKIKIFDENIYIYEGTETYRNVKVYGRSKELRDASIEHYTKFDGSIPCKVCDFDFRETYGNVGSGFIEIHHDKPIYMFEDGDKKQTIDKAIKNTSPLCANCHRMVHRKRPPYLVSNISDFLKEAKQTI